MTISAGSETTADEILRREDVPALDQMLGRRLQVLDDGFVRVVDYMGSDSSIVQAARVSYGAGTKRLREDRALIRYLLRNAHTSPFEMCEIKMHVRVPMDTWRQWVRHRTASINEYSTRYSVAIDAAQKTLAADWRLQSTQNRQGSEGHLDLQHGSRLSQSERDLQSHARRVYEERLALGVAREQARKDLPLSTYTEAYWKIDLHNLLHFLSLRLDPHAQKEIREYASIIAEQIVRAWVPLAWEAFTDFSLDVLRLSRLEEAIALHVNRGEDSLARDLASRAGLLNASQQLTSEGLALASKFARLGIKAPF